MMLGTPGMLGRLNLNCCTRISGRLNTSVPAKVAKTPSRKPRTKLRLAGESQRDDRDGQVNEGAVYGEELAPRRQCYGALLSGPRTAEQASTSSPAVSPPLRDDIV